MSRLTIKDIKTIDTFWAEINMAGDINWITKECAKYCEKGLCVTITQQKFVYTGGIEDGEDWSSKLS